jgi:phage baseplate assembly protein W
MIDWTLSGKDRIAQNVRNLINTYCYEVAYHRTMGLPGSLIDRPSNIQLEEARVKVRQMIAIYEPRAKVKDVSCRLNKTGEAVVEVILA